MANIDSLVINHPEYSSFEQRDRLGADNVKVFAEWLLSGCQL